MFVVDADVLIHLDAGGLVAELFELGHEIVASDITLDELRDGPPARETLVALGLAPKSLTGQRVVDVAHVVAANRGVSVQDVSAMLVAEDEGCVLLTGDGSLRVLAKCRGVEVHGVLWLLDRLLEQGLREASRAADALEAMLAVGARLPLGECEARIKLWRGAR